MTQQYFSKEFLCLASLKKELTGDEQDVLMCRLADELDIKETIRILHISEATLQGRMKSIYKKFEIAGDGRGKFPRLRRILCEIFEEYKQSSMSSDVTSDTQSVSEADRIDILERDLEALKEVIKQDMSSILQTVKNLEDRQSQECIDETIIEISNPIEFMSGLSAQLIDRQDSADSIIRQFSAALPILIKKRALESHHRESDIAVELIDAFKDVLVADDRRVSEKVNLRFPKGVDKV